MARPTGRWSEPVAVAALIVLAAAVRIPTLDQPLLEEHSFRQTQTAYTALLFHLDGVDLMHPKLPVLGEPFEVPFEFPLFQAAAAVPMSWGLAADTAARTTGLIFFLVSAVVLYLVVRRAAGGVAAIVALAGYLFSPFAMLWGRTSMIEYLAVAASLGFVLAAMLWIERPRVLVGLLAVVLITVAMLVKITTAVFWVLPALAYLYESERTGRRPWVARRLPLAGFVLVALVLAFAWTAHADAIKSSNPATTWLTSGALTEWNFGTLDQRMDAGNWVAIVGRFNTFGWAAALAVVSLIPVIRHRQRLFWAAWMLAGLLPIAVFFNLYVVHNYYLAAVTPAVAGLTGLGAAWLWDRWRGGPRLALVGLLVVALAGSLWTTRHDWGRAYGEIDPNLTLSALAEIRASTQPDDLLIVEGYDWDPTLLYYARRRGQMIAVGKFVTPEFVLNLPTRGYRHLVTPALSETTEELVSSGSWERLGAQLYRIVR